MIQLNFRIPKTWVAQMQKIAIAESSKRGKTVIVADIIRETLQKNLLLPGEYKKYEHKKSR